MDEKAIIPRVSIACEACRSRKRKCDTHFPCSYCTAKQIPCNYANKKKRGPKKRRIEEGLAFVVDPSPIETIMAEQMEAFTYFDSCWEHIPKLHMLSSITKIKNPNSVAQKVQAYAALAYTTRLCGNKSKSIVYMDQARMLAGQIFDMPDGDAISAVALMSFYYTLTFDLTRSKYYCNLGISLAKMVPKEKLDYKLYVYCKLNSIIADIESTTQQKREQLEELEEYINKIIATNSNMLGIWLLLTMLHKVLVELVDQSIFYTAPKTKLNFFELLDNLVVSEEVRLHVFELIINILVKTEATPYGTHIGFVTKLLMPILKTILNWKSGHLVEAMDGALTCYANLQMLDNDCLYGLMSHFPQFYLLGALVKIFLEQGHFSLAEQMTAHIKKICNKMSPDLDTICEQMDRFMITNSNKNSNENNNSNNNDIAGPTNNTLYSPALSSSTPSFSPSPPSISTSYSPFNTNLFNFPNPSYSPLEYPSTFVNSEFSYAPHRLPFTPPSPTSAGLNVEAIEKILDL